MEDCSNEVLYSTVINDSAIDYYPYKLQIKIIIKKCYQDIIWKAFLL